MFASVLQTTLLWSAQASNFVVEDDASDLSLFGALGVVLFILGGVWLIALLLHSDARAPQSRRPVPVVQRARPVAAVQGGKSDPAVRRIARRVIRLHAVTPGLLRHEYNVGDPSGTRGSALVRMGSGRRG